MPSERRNTQYEQVDRAFRKKENSIVAFGTDMGGVLLGNGNRKGKSINLNPEGHRVGFEKIGWGMNELSNLYTDNK